MSEKEPGKDYYFYFTVDGEQYESTPDNTYIVIHERADHRKYDYIASLYGDPDDPGLYMSWREEGDTTEFEQMIYDMHDAGFEITNTEQAANTVIEMYEQHHQQKPVEITIQEPTPRQEKVILFLHYLFAHDRLTIADFEQPGDLFI